MLCDGQWHRSGPLYSHKYLSNDILLLVLLFWDYTLNGILISSNTFIKNLTIPSMFHHHTDLTSGLFIMLTIYHPIMGILIGVQVRVDTKIQVIDPWYLSLDLMVHTWDLGPPHKFYKGNIWNISEIWCFFQGLANHRWYS